MLEPRALSAALIAGLVAACGCDAPDPRLATPEATVETLLQAHHLTDAGFLRPRGERPPPDIDTVARCFWDYDRDDTGSRAMGEFVAGMLAAGQGQLEYRVRGRRAVVRSMHRTIAMRKTGDGWLIVLRDSVPEEIRNGLENRPRRLPEHEMP